MRVVVLLAFLVAAVSATPTLSNASQRIVGGSVTNINQYPDIASLLFSISNSGHRQACGGVIVNNRSIMTAAHCIFGDVAARWRVRLGSNYANSAGVIYNAARTYIHPQFNRFTSDNDIAMIRLSSNIRFTNVIQAARIAGPNYFLADNQIVWAAGWGLIFSGPGGVPSEPLRHVQIWSINQITCRQRFLQLGRTITDNMLCAGVLDVPGRGQCYGDNGGPVYHNGVTVGVYSFGSPGSCADGRFPGVNTRISRYSAWISSNA